MHWEKSVPSNLFRIAGIPVNRSSDKRGLSVFGIDSGIDLIQLSKHIRFPSYHCLWALHIYYTKSFVPMNMVLKTYLACRTFSKCQSYNNENYLSKHTYTYKIDADNQLHNCICGARCLSRWGFSKYTCKITAGKND